MSKTLLITTMLILYVVLSSCRSKTKAVRHLHNWPIYKGQDCPTTAGNYDEEYVRIRAKQLNIRPVDYLHKYSKQRYKPTNQYRNVGFTNNKENE